MKIRKGAAAFAALALILSLLTGCQGVPEVGVSTGPGTGGQSIGGQGSGPSTQAAVPQTPDNYERIYDAVMSLAEQNVYDTVYDGDAEAAGGNLNGAGSAPGAPNTTTRKNSTAATTAAAATAGEGSYSDTNVQVEGVQEADVIKTDGRYIYIVYSENLSIVRADGGQTELVARVPVTDSRTVGDVTYDGVAVEMYVAGDRLVLIRQCYEAWDASKSPLFHGGLDTVTEAVYYDIHDPANPRLIQRLGQSGSYLSSRMVGNYVYIVSQFWLYGEPDKARPGTFVPNLLTGSALRPVSPDTVYIPDQPSSLQYLVLTGADAANPEKHLSSQSLLDVGSTLYATENSLYIAAQRWTYTPFSGCDATRLLRFSMEKGVLRKQAEGEVPGSILNQFSMDEYDGYFRIVTTNRGWRTTVGDLNTSAAQVINGNNLYVLDGNLKITGKLENLAPDETVRSVRFDGEIGYFVTFRQTDPLFAVNLRDPAAPSVQSKLKIPGFSEYLHPWNSELLFGLGRDADEITGQVGGVKLSMFRISDPENVTEQNKTLLGIGYPYSDACYNHKAVLIDAGRNLIGFPVQNQMGIQSYMVYSYDSEKGFVLRGEMESIFTDWMRGMYIGDFLYIATPHTVSSYRLSDLKPVSLLNLP